jgi:hypothetical protein
MVVENVNGAQKWVGKARWHFGSYYLWGDVPALMPLAVGRKVETRQAANSPSGTGKTSWFFGNSKHEMRGVKNGNDWFGSGANCSLQRRYASCSDARKQASAAIAKIPFPLARHIAQVYKTTG